MNARRLGLLAAASLWACGEPSAPVTQDAARPEPAGDAAPLPDATVRARLLHVEAGADAAGADGTRDRPYPDLAAAYAAARPGDVVFLLPGEHGAALAPPDDVELLGSGPGVSIVDGPLRLSRAGARIRGLTVRGGEPGVELTAPATLVDLQIAGASAEVYVEVHFERVEVIESVGIGVQVHPGAHLRWRGGGARSTGGDAVRSQEARLDIEGLAVRDPGGFGIYADGGTITADRIQVSGAAGAGLRFIEAETTATRVEVLDTRYEAGQGSASGVGFIGGHGVLRSARVRGGDRAVRVTRAARVEVWDVEVTGAVDGLSAADGAIVQATDLRVRGVRNTGVVVTRAEADLDQVTIQGTGRIGVLVSDGRLGARAVAVEDAAARGVAILSASARIADLQVRRAGDVGLQVTDPTGAVAVEGGVFEDCGTSGVGAFGRGPEPVVLKEVAIRGTRLGAEQLAHGLHLLRAHVRCLDLTSEENEGAGVFAEGSTLSLEGARLRGNTEPGLVLLEAEGDASVAGVEADDNGGAGILVVGSAGRLHDVRAHGNRFAAAVGPGDGVAAAFGADVEVARGTLRENAGSGLSLIGVSAARLADTELSGNAGAGVNVACDGSRLTEAAGNRYADNAAGDRGGCP